jgi:hypothetical protein
MVAVELPIEWLIEAWGGKKKQELPHVMTIDGTDVKVVILILPLSLAAPSLQIST